MRCPTCSSENSEVAAFCYRCGTSLRAGGGDAKRSSYAVQSAEGVTHFGVVSTVMPHTSRRSADNYRWAMIASAVLILGATALGLLPIAVAAAAFLVPLAYLVYLYDANLWERAPAWVVGGVFVATGVLSVLVSLFFFDWVFDSQWASFAGGGHADVGISSLSLPALLIFAVLLPVVAEVAKNVFAVLLARRPQFDDMIDALTFGVAAGTAYAAFETVVVFSSVFTDQDLRTESGLGSWLVVVLNVMVVKSLIYGTATGIAVAAFSGKGQGYDGFTPAYLAHFGLAVAANIAYWLGVRLLALLPFGNALGLIWGFVILAALVIKIRMMLQAALLEAAVEAAVKGDGSVDTRSTFVEAHCPECENLLPVNAAFCMACGTSVRSSSRQARGAMGIGAAPADPAAPAVKSGEGSSNSSRLKVIGLITAATVAVGALGLIAGALLDAEPADSDPVPSVSDSTNGTGGGQARLGIPAGLAAALAAEEAAFVALDNGVEIFVPAGWDVYYQDDVNMNFTNNRGSYAYAYSGGGFDPAASAASVVLTYIDDILPPDSYTGRTVSAFVPWGEPFGTVVSVGMLEFSATWVDNQGSQPIYGQIYAAVRQDGTVLIHLIEHIPPEGFNAAYDGVPIVSPSFARFGGVG